MAKKAVKVVAGLAAVAAGLLLLLRVFAAIVYDIHYIKQGETWESIARRYGLTVQALMDANKGVTSLKPGEILVIPRLTSASSSLSATSRLVKPPVMAEAVERTPSASLPGGRTAGRNPSTKAEKPEVIGELGIVTVAPAPIRLDPSPNSPKVYTCSKGQQLLIRARRGQWLGVLMANGSICWIPAQYVRLTGLQLVRRGGTARGGNPLGPRIVAEAMRYLGCPYKYGGTNPRTGLDCSAFVQLIFRNVGIRLPRTAAEQFKVGIPVPLDQLQPGDRLYFSRSGGEIDHTGIYIGGGQFIHATSRYGKVVISSLYDPRYWSILVGARR